MPSIMPQLLEDTKLNIDIKLENADLPTTSSKKVEEGTSGLTFKMKGFEGN